ncbi:MAG TPA: FtsX-like permease family protein, partial [Actinomycetales bacterium]|nr:FtsX-like permease family protein [Actinomycetales bacterium]
MGSRFAAWRPALRIARRDVLRAKGRSALVAVMVGLPVALVTCFTAVYATDQVSPVESIPARLGATAAELEIFSDQPVWQDPQLNQYGVVDREGDSTSPGEPRSASDVASMLQRLTGGRIVDLPTARTLVHTERGRIDTNALVADAGSPRLRGLVRLLDGRLPRADDEVVVSRDLAERGYGIGSTIGLDDGAKPATVVGTGEVPYPGMRSTVVALPGLGLPADDASHRYLLDRAAPLTWPQVRQLNQAGVLAFSRRVVEHPPADWKSALPPDAQYWSGSGLSSADTAVLSLVVFSIVLEVVLLAGPAFAVGVRRQQRQLALVTATGGSARDVRRVVLAQGMALGLGASAIGAASGVGLARLLVWALPRFRGTRLGPWDVDWRSTGAALALGAVASVVAAWVPARAASRADVVAVLAGRRGQTRTRRGWPMLGVLLVAVGIGVAFALGTRPGGEFGVAGGTLVMVLGAIAAMPALIGLVGRLGAHLPLPLR